MSIEKLALEIYWYTTHTSIPNIGIILVWYKNMVVYCPYSSYTMTQFKMDMWIHTGEETVPMQQMSIS